MRKYIGTKTIEAESMTMGEADEKCLIVVGGKLSKEERSINGYHVKYDNDIESWLPKDEFEKAYQLAETPLDRMYIEYKELMDKHNKLVLFLGRKDAVEIAGKDQVALMEVQKVQMHDYLLTLKERIDLMKK